ncbi:uncharacterized protein ACLA_084110 [Aspergillus clavatus NRRL 1]|uniref:Uncharacterized protein n=1 Tax=Aspergillus clavatus (strain ATCC 1007 / CBS 513.65 / DSM 816 / NCTC 3887 / NRRL 1 / QM 1276 / 107) TaxID=344612 RepID=A1CTS9_ASPCL|nr:uncharacterized protein ACLA_084110 [Aspergillus clavatus NRRL 1]EAW06716.1 conserved hypothetical protein [Aspergillus clavatus NRRL 1]
MSHGRVIQDSDDEDDPLSEMPPPIKRPPEQPQEVNGTHIVNEAIESVENTDEHQQSENGDHIGVDFDAFLQSQETAQNGLSASQQRREERWIPSNAGAGSIGSVMTEIGLAQQRLFDDDEDAQHAGARVPRVAVPGEAAMPLNMAISNYDDYHHQGNPGVVQPTAFATPTSQDMALLNANKHGYGYSNNDITGFYGDHVLHVGTSNNLLSHDFAQSSTSYNFFESSLNLPAHANGALHSSVGSHGTIPTEVVHKTPGRSHSMHATFYSPHDTEPISSLASPGVRRAKSDAASRDALPQSSTSAFDELSASVAIEVPTIKKKRGRKRKQDLPEDDEDDELALSENQDSIPVGVVEKRRPGRPPKNARIVDTESNNLESGSGRPQGQSVGISGEPHEFREDPSVNDSGSSRTTINGVTHDVPKHEELHIIVTDTPKEDQESVSVQLPAEIDLPASKPSKKTKEPKKKKLKRGKTTSVTLKKTYESDVEDDVIWIDERPSNPTNQVEQAPQHPIHDLPPVKVDHVESANVEIPKPQPPSLAEVNRTEALEEEPEPAPPTPKKRGRKRKKTSEQTISETPFAPVDDTPTTRDVDQGLQLGNVSVVLERPSDDITMDNQLKTDTIPHESTPPPEPLSSSKPSTTEPNLPITPSKISIPATLEENDTNTDPKTKDPARGPDKHSPISGTSKVPYRVGLSRRARIAPLLKIVRR